ncbi:MAG: GFA family protein [Myxococcales bacterium]|nr:GFA family protein [Myxococcales bacterium]
MLNGECLCGSVAWEIEGPLKKMGHCHCSMCRKWHGTAYATFVTFDKPAFRWVRGEDHIAGYEAVAGSVRLFCRTCGSKLPALEPFAWSPAGPLVGDLGLTPSMHIFVASKAPWHTIRDDVAQLAEYPSGIGTPIDSKRATDAEPGKIRGACLCGRAAYEIDGPLEGGSIVSCHCSRCRRARGALHGSNLFIEAESFRWLRGQDAIASFKVPDAVRFAQSFCATCGSAMPGLTPQSGRRAVPAGTLEDDPGIREGLHIFVKSRAPWEVIAGDLPQFDEYPCADFPILAQAKTA